jgi:DNA-binding MurR/RpiR family transcriptional regulator
MISKNEAKQNIMNAYENMTQVERSIADFFVSNVKLMDFSSKNIAQILYVSEATMSRFAKKCGYKGYRELIYSYEKDLEEELQDHDISLLTRRVKGNYKKLLDESFEILKEDQINRISTLLHDKKRVFVYGMGSSGYAALEFQLRFMRLGLNVEAVTDSQMIQMNAALVDETNLIIAISLSGKTKEVMQAVRISKMNHAGVILITSNNKLEEEKYCDEILYVAMAKNLDGGTTISPQFPILVMIDIFYSYYLANDSYYKVQKYKETLIALHGGKRDEA